MHAILEYAACQGNLKYFLLLFHIWWNFFGEFGENFHFLKTVFEKLEPGFRRCSILSKENTYMVHTWKTFVLFGENIWNLFLFLTFWLRKMKWKRFYQSKLFRQVGEIAFMVLFKSLPFEKINFANLIYIRANEKEMNAWNSFRIIHVIFICAIAGILLKSQEFYFFCSVQFLSWYWKIQIFCSAVSISVRFKFLKLPATIRFSCDGTSES